MKKLFIFSWFLLSLLIRLEAQSITVTAPNGSESWTGCTTQSITWTATGTSNYFSIDYSTDGGSSWTSVTSFYNTTGGTYSWTVPNVSSSNCKVKITDSNNSGISDISDNVFTINAALIVTLPNGGESWEAGTNKTITFAWSGTSNYYNLYYSTDAGANWNTIVTSQYITNGTYNWNVANDPSTTSLVKVTDYYSTCKSDKSDNLFTIAPPTHVINVTNPNTATTRYIGNTYNITWTSSYLSSPYVMIELSSDNGSTWATVVSATNNTGSYSWTVPNSPSTQALIRISEVGNPSCYDVSNENFIISSPVVTLTYPNGGESFTGCYSKTLTWTSGGTSGTFKLEYSADNGSTWTIITTSASGSSYNWQTANISTSQCKIRLSDASHNETTDQNDAVFTITSNTDIIVSTPNGGESWEAGTTKRINYALAPSTTYVNIDYSTDNGSNWNSIATYYTYLYWDWNVPNSPSVNCKIRVKDSYNTCIKDENDALFTISPPTHVITVTSPNTAITRYIGNSYNITWTSAYLTSSFVKIELSTDNGSTWSTLVTATNNNGSYSWIVPSQSSTECLIKISEVGNPSCFDISNTNFIIAPPFITVTSPNGSETWEGCESRSVTWSSGGASGYFKLEYSTNNGISWSSIVNSTTGSSYNWTVANLNSTEALIRISDYNNLATTDQSDAAFTLIPNSDIIITTPTGVDSWEAGTVKRINYALAPTTTRVNIDYSIDNGTNWTSITTYVSALYWDWSVPNAPSPNSKIRVIDYYNTCIRDENDGVFTIAPPTHVITVTSPNTAITRYIGNTYNITWTSAYLTSSFVKIELSADNGSTWSNVVTTTNNNGTYSWSVPNQPSSQCQIKISEVGNPSCFDINNENFTIAPPYVTLTLPNGGESWEGCETRTITWNSGGTSNYFKIEYSVNHGSTWSTIISSSTGSSYNWTVANLNSTQTKIKISDANNLATTDTTDGVFTLLPNTDIIISTPNGGENWEVGTVNRINYALAPTTTKVNIDYSTDYGTNWTGITTYNSSLYWDWSVPNVPSSNCKVRVIDYYNTCIRDENDALFTITPPTHVITVTSPNTAITRYIGNSYNITWTSAYLSSSFVKIDLSTDNGSSWSQIVAATTNNGSYSWVVPNQPSMQCLIKISEVGNPSCYDVSNTNFTIAPPIITVTSPNGSETWEGCESRSITWNSGGTSGYFKVEYSINTGSTWSTIVNQTTSSSYSWTVANLSSSAALIRVSDYNNLATTDQSDAVFTLVPNTDIIVTAPAIGASWEAGTQKTITWAAAPTSTYFSINYSTDNGANWTQVLSYTSSFSYSWSVPNTPSATSFVKVTDYYNSCINDINDAVFTIAPPTHVIIVTSPNTAITRYIGNTYSITWNSAYLTSSFVKIELSIDNGSNWSTIVGTTNNNGTYSWLVPSTPSMQCQIKISEVGNPSCFDINNENFTIAPPYIAVTSPNGGETWKGCESRSVTWNSGGTSGYFKLEYSSNNGSTWTSIVNSTTGSSYSWTVPNLSSSEALIRISDANNLATKDTSNAFFTIIPNTDIIVTSPNGGESWEVGTVHAITFASAPTSTSYKVDYSADNGNNWTSISSYLTSTTTNWTIPNAPANQSFVRVSDYYNSCINDRNDVVFTIAPPTPVITITNPSNPGLTRYVGSSASITWTSAYLSSTFVKIEYSIDNGVTWLSVVSATNNNGSYSWTVPNTLSGNCLVKISDYGNPATYDVSNNVFAIAPAILLTSPNGDSGNEQMRGCTETTITWVAGGTSYYYKLEYSIDNGTTWSSIATSYYTGSTNCSYNWTIPNSPSTQCLVRVTDSNTPSKTDVSDHNFTITAPLTLTFPNYGGSYQVGAVKDITWIADGTSNYYNIDYSVTGGSSWINVVYNQYNTGTSYSWTIPSNPSTNCKVRIVDNVNTCKQDISDEPFTISASSPAILVTSPNGNESWSSCTDHPITWNVSGTSDYYNISYSINGGSTWNLMVSNYYSTSHTYSWTIPNTGGIHCLVRISDYNAPVKEDKSDAAFSIIAPTAVASNDVTLCSGLSTQLEATGGVSFSWSPSTGLNNPSISNPIASPASTTTYTVTILDANGCAASDDITVTVSPLPLNPATPDGIIDLCENNSNTNYTTTGAGYASTYTWELLPVEAGTISGTGTMAIADWNNSFTGSAAIRVKGINACGLGNFSNALTVQVRDLPAQAAIPAGEIALCENNTSTTYTTPGANYATSYLWSISPAEAGILTGTGASVVVDWNNNFSGTAQIFVKGQNNCGDGPLSDGLTVTLDPFPLQAAVPVGVNTVCQDAANSGFTTSGSTHASSFIWNISPSNAGIISGTTSSATVDWNASFYGEAQIKVKGHNLCGDGIFSDVLLVNVSPLPGIASTPEGAITLCQDASNTSFTTTGATNSISYEWNLSPSEAGSISGTATTGIVDWNESFTGQAIIKVKGKNSCGDGVFSNELTVNIQPLPLQAAKPAGITNLCQANANSVYTTSGATNATTYNWSLVPSLAGEISGTGTSVVVDWAESYTGSTVVYAQGVNTCGNGIISEGLEVTLNPLPGIPAKPSGEINLCMNSVNSTYTTSGASQVISYIWIITPSNAGIISGSTTSATIDWNDSFTGEVRINVKGHNDCGDGIFSDSLLVNVLPLPGLAASPVGATTLCQNALNTSYSTTGAINATHYEWSISPFEAGSINGITETATIDWSDSFSGMAYIKVKGNNSCGDGVFSNDLTVNIQPFPGQAAKPAGSTNLCQNNANSVYTTTGAIHATTYIWSLVPPEAGAISGTGINAAVDWADSFSGSALVYVMGVNACGNGIISDELEVTLNPLPGIPAKPSGEINLCMNSANSVYTTSGAVNATEYQWNLTPPEAGSISGTSLNVIVDWNNSFTGNASISVIAVNSCGQSVSSQSLSVTITPLPGIPLAPTGSTSLCMDQHFVLYHIENVTNATSYSWSIAPPDAGIISGTGVYGSVDYDQNYYGSVEIRAKALNSCGESAWSPAISVLVSPIPFQAAAPTGEADLCINNANTSYQTAGAAYANSYNWILDPGVGIVTTSMNDQASINWSNSFTGIATLKVQGINSCGNGALSQPLTINIYPLPSIPAVPLGSASVCQGEYFSTFTISKVSNASAYLWNMSPPSAGTMIQNDTSVTVEWNLTFNGTVNISVKATNNCGESSYSSALSVLVNALPAQPATPTGIVVLCKNSSTTSYTTSGAVGATSYLWSLIPAEAGVITGSVTSAIITWNSDYSGMASVMVKGINSCGSGIYSQSLSIVIGDTPAQATIPAGSVNLCQTAFNTSYSVLAVSGASNYSWSLLPSEAGAISGNGTTGIVDWNDIFSGNAFISVIANNGCGNALPSNPLAVAINPLPETAAIPSGETLLCINSSNTSYSTLGAGNASSYIWILNPSSAGVIIPDGDTVVINWNDTWSGTAQLSVKSINSCGEGTVSGALTITVEPLPLTPDLPSGETLLCSGNANTTYSTTVTTGATSYSWNINPSEAGNIAGTGITSTVDWIDAFNGTAIVSVAGVNTCGTGSQSQALTVSFQQIPGEPAIPSGPTNLCQNASSTTFFTSGAVNATTFDWSIIPAQAGNINGTGNYATVDWDPVFTGIVSIQVKGVNSCGPGPAATLIGITVNPAPLVATIPDGPVNVCQGVAKSSYTTTGASYATSYSWSLNPSNAGTLSGTGTAATIEWSSTFSGNAIITVQGTNACGTGPLSNPLAVTVAPHPLMPGAPTGPLSVCENTTSTVFSTSGAQYAVSYIWMISPANAGNISGTSSSGNVNWNPGFSGNAQITVKGINSCGEGSVSPPWNLSVNPIPGTSGIPVGETTLCQNSADKSYSTPGAEFGTSYSWSLTPVEAGIISGSITTATVNSSESYNGMAYISVKAHNSCGDGPASPNLSITINPLPGTPAMPSGDPEVCQGDAGVNYVSTQASNADSYLWWLAPLNAGSMTPDGISVNISWSNSFSGNALLSLKGINGCGPGTFSDALPILVNSLPPKPVISRQENQLISSSETGNQWFDQQGPVEGATAQVFNPQQNGIYRVVVTNAQECYEESDGYYFTFVDVQITELKQISIYPNPSEGKFTLEWSNLNETVDIQIINFLGKVVYRTQIENTAELQSKNIDLSNLSKGMYAVIISAGKEKRLIKVTLQ